jgi:DNA polymerase-1
MKLAMIRSDNGLREAGVRSRMLLQVHDELVLESPQEEIERVVALVREAMGGAVELVVPLVVDVKVGENWQAMAPLLETASAGAS